MADGKVTAFRLTGRGAGAPRGDSGAHRHSFSHGGAANGHPLLRRGRGARGGQARTRPPKPESRAQDARDVRSAAGRDEACRGAGEIRARRGAQAADPLRRARAARSSASTIPPRRVLGAARYGVVLCNPIGTDQTRSDRTYRHLAERLAAAGFACLRFDLFAHRVIPAATSARRVSSRAWLDDVEAACAELRRSLQARSRLRSSGCASGPRSR